MLTLRETGLHGEVFTEDISAGMVVISVGEDITWLYYAVPELKKNVAAAARYTQNNVTQNAPYQGYARRRMSITIILILLNIEAIFHSYYYRITGFLYYY